MPRVRKRPELVKQFVQAMDIPYPCAIGDDAILEKIPNFHAFPTTMVLDRAGKVRMLVLENSEGVISAVDSIVQVLLAEPATPASAKSASARETAKPKESPTPAKPADAVSTLRPK